MTYDPVTITRITAEAYRVPIARTVNTSFGRMTDRPGVFLRIESADGCFSWGEAFANWPAAGPSTNDTDFGLSSCLYSEQSDVIERFIAESESGMLYVNPGTFPENHTPFVGVKDSAHGVGGSNGAATIQFHTTEHAVYRKARA